MEVDMASPERALEWMREGETCEQQNKVPAAIRAFEHAARSSDPKVAADACYHLGLCYEQQHHYTSAVRAYRDACKSGDQETMASAYYHLGRIYEHRHWLSDAYATYQHSVRLGGKDSARARGAIARLWPDAA
jgi:cytochrome c-type biogenesis protein CcmH/NrfG